MGDNQSTECLKTLLQDAEPFVNDDYRNIALQYSTSLQILREIYSCACDNVPAKEVQGVLEKKNDASYLRQLRYERIVNEAIGDGKNKLADLSAIADTIHSKLASMEKTIKNLQENSSDLNELFVDMKPPKDAVVMSVAKNGLSVGAYVRSMDRSTTGENNKTASYGRNTASANEGSDSKRAYSRKRRLTHRQKKDAATYIALLKKEGYTSEQISYVLDLLESGMKPAETDSFIHPGLSVEMMEKLRLMKEKSNKNINLKKSNREDS